MGTKTRSIHTQREQEKEEREGLIQNYITPRGIQEQNIQLLLLYCVNSLGNAKKGGKK